MPPAEESPAGKAANYGYDRDEPRTLGQLSFDVGGLLQPLLQLVQIMHKALACFENLPSGLGEFSDVIARGPLRQVGARRNIRILIVCQHTRVNPASYFPVHS